MTRKRAKMHRPEHARYDGKSKSCVSAAPRNAQLSNAVLKCWHIVAAIAASQSFGAYALHRRLLSSLCSSAFLVIEKLNSSLCEMSW